MPQPFEVLAGSHFPAVVDGQVVHRAPIINAISSPRKPCTIVVQQKRNYAECALYCAQWGRVLTKCPGGTSCFMGFMPQGGLQICTKHRLTQIFPNTSFMQWEIPKKQNLVKCCMLWHVIPNKCMKNIVLMLTLLTFFHSMTNTKDQHQIHHLHR